MEPAKRRKLVISNLEKFKKDLGMLIKTGSALPAALMYGEDKPGFAKQAKEQLGDQAGAYLKGLPNFKEAYQAWYSEAKALIRQLLPDRVEDFARHYERPKSRKDITYENYTIEDALQGIHVTKGYQKEKVVGPDAAVPRIQQQAAIVEAAKGRFESSLFDIRQLLQADLFDSEIDAANHLLKNKFARAAGALGGVVLEKHLGEVCTSHNVVLRKKDPAISDLNEGLKSAGVTDTVQWRFIQHLGDIRNLCDHNKKTEPTDEQVHDLLTGVAKVTKTIF
jgi:tetratricopeptide (TPR) repeat protein